MKMKQIIPLSIVLLAVSCATTQKPAEDSLSQNEPSTYVVVDYKNIVQDHVNDYLKVEEYWKPVHQQRINDDRMKAWLLLKVGNEENKDLPYNFITLNVYDDMDKASKGPTTEDWISAHGSQKYRDNGPKMRTLTQKVNNIIRRDRCKTVSSIYSLTKYRKANFMKTKAGQRDAFIESRKSFIKPIFDKMIHDIDAPMNGWILNEVLIPEGVEKDYDFISFDLFKDKSDIGRSNPQKNYTKLAHPSLSDDQAKAYREKNFQMRKMVKSEVWEVVDFAFKEKNINGVWSFEDNDFKSGKLANSSPLKIIRDGNFLVLHMKDGVIGHVHTGSSQYDGDKIIEKISATSVTDDDILGKNFTFNINPTPNSFIQLGKNQETGEDWREMWKRATKNTFNRSGIEGVWVRPMNNTDTVMVKFILDHTWVWIVVNKKTGEITKSLGGTFEYDAPSYSETPKFHYKTPNGLGGMLQSKISVKEDDMSLEGHIVSSTGEKNPLKETWKRFKW